MISRKKLNRIKGKYSNIFKALFLKIDVEALPKKYRNFDDNFKRLVSPITKACDDGHTVGLDFGCGIGGCCVLGHLMGLKMTGIDIPEAEGKPSPYLSLQTELNSQGYPIVMADTNEYPWEFDDDQFDFVILYFSINKEFMHSELGFERRLEELLRITKKDGSWYIWPTMHFNLMTRKSKDRTFDKDSKVKIVLGV